MLVLEFHFYYLKNKKVLRFIFYQHYSRNSTREITDLFIRLCENRIHSCSVSSSIVLYSELVSVEKELFFYEKKLKCLAAFVT